jgi:predicted enzyme related to lactoylglutathione lyase
MFWKIGFFVLFALLVAAVWIFMKSNPMKNEGASFWVDIYSAAPTETVDFLGRVFGIQQVKSQDLAQEGMDYKVIRANGQMWPFAGVTGLPTDDTGMTAVPGTMIYLTVKDHDASSKKMIENGAKMTFGPKIVDGMAFSIYEIPGGLYIGIAQYEHVKGGKK